MVVEVFVLKVDDDINTVVHEALERLRWREVIGQESVVLIKPNLLTMPKRGITTDMDLLRSVINIVKERAKRVIIGETDSTGRTFDEIIDTLDKSNLNCDILNLSRDETLIVNGNHGNYNLPKLVFESHLINLPVLKTHTLTKITGAIKNLFGLIQDRDKESLHWKIDGVLADLYEILQPKLNILDAIYSMDGNGPIYGRVRYTGFIMASRDALALDCAACELIGLDPKGVDHLRIAMSKRALEYKVVGEVGDLETLKDFKIPNITFDKFSAQLLRYYNVRRALKPIVRWFMKG
ncbi:MAG: DUF362 domain-containing protein [Nitrososphaerales archaeon]|nr:DUF362 domain-containing protein [Nitrososphaerales archaeon]